MRTPKQQLARELSRMHPEDRALSKAIRTGPFDGIKSLSDLIRRGLLNAHAVGLKRAAALLAIMALSSGCALNASVRYPWDKQQDHHESAPPKAAPAPTPEPTPEATPAHYQFDEPWDTPTQFIAARRIR